MSTNTMSTISASNEDILFEQSNDEIIFSVKYLHISFSNADTDFLHRSEDNDENYRICCGETFKMPLFPSQLSESSKCRPEFILLSRLVLSVRVRRLVLCDQYEKYSVNLSDLRELEYICEEKWKLFEKRLSQLEEEMVQLKLSDKIQISSRFHALLSNNLGRTTVSIYLQHECHNLLKSNDLTRTESIKGISLADIYYSWEILKYWLLIKSIQIQCESGIFDVSLIDSTSLINNSSHHHYKRQPITSDALLSILDISHFLSHKSNELSLLQILNKVLHLILIKNYFRDKIQSSTIQFVNIALGKVQPRDTKSADMSASLSFLLDDLSNTLESIMLIGLRKSPTWANTLQTLRRDRVIKSGGQIVIRNGAEVEIDKLGATRAIILAEDTVDTNILHGSSQRIKIQNALEEAVKAIDILIVKRDKISGELPCVIQYGFEKTLPYLQRNFRKTLARIKRTNLLRDITYRSMHAAACVIQSWFKKLRQVWVYREMRIPDYDLFAAEIQRIYRGYRQRLAFSDFREAYLIKRKNNAILTIQKWIRGFLARRRVMAIRNSLVDARIEDTKQWAAIVIQKRVRGRLARRTVLRSLRIRQALSQDVLHLASQYLHHGDLWGFLRDIDRRFKHMNELAHQSQQQEDEWAKTFVEKVLTKRKTEFDGAWNRFSTALGNQRKSGISSNKFKNDTHHHGQSPIYPIEENSDVLSAISFDGFSAGGLLSPIKPKRVSKKNAKGNKSAAGIPISKKDIRHNQRDLGVGVDANIIPGTVLRRAVTATVKNRVEVELEKLKKSNSNLDDVRNAYRDSSKRSSSSHPKKQKSNPSNTSPAHSHLNPVTSGASASTSDPRSTSPPSKYTTGGSKLYRQPKKVAAGNGQSAGGGGIVASSANWMEKAAAVECGSIHSTDGSLTSYGYSKQSTTQSAGNSAAMMKGQISSTSGISQPVTHHRETSANFQRECSPQKFSRHSSSQSQTSSNNSHNNNSSSVGASAVHPVNVRGPNPGESLLIDIPLGLEDTVERLIRAASVRSYVPDFFPNDTIESAYAVFLRLPQGLSRIRYEQAAWNWGQITLDRLKNKKLIWIRDLLPASKLSMYFRGVEAPKPLEEECIRLVLELKKGNTASKGSTHMDSVAKHAILSDDGGTVTQVLEAASQLRPLPAVPKPLLRTTTSDENCSSKSKGNIKDVDMALIDKLMHEMLTQGSWTNLKLDIEDFLQQAAYFVCQHIPFVSKEDTTTASPTSLHENENDTITNTSDNLVGVDALKSHLIELQLLKAEEEDRRTAIRNRVQQAKEIVFPFVIYLKAQNVNKVIDLARSNLKSTLLPPILLNQVEEMINTAVVLAIQSKSSTNKRAFKQSSSASTSTTPLMYDPRFQRSPFDPYGRPPRIDSLTSLVASSASSVSGSSKSKDKKNSSSNRRNKSIDVDVLPVENDDNTIQNMSVLTDIDSVKDFPDQTLLPGGLWSSSDSRSIIEEQEDEGDEDDDDDGGVDQDGIISAQQKTSMDYMGTERHRSTGASRNSIQDNKQLSNIKSVRFGTNIINEIDNDNDNNDDEEEEEEEEGHDYDSERNIDSIENIRENLSPSTQRSNKDIRKDIIPISSTNNTSLLTKIQNVKDSNKLVTKSASSIPTALSTDSKVWKDTHVDRKRNHPIIKGTYVCSHAGCYQTFSRAYTLNIHEKSHVLFSQYHQYKRNPMLFLDPGREEMVAEKEALLSERVSLPPLIQKDFEIIRQKISSANSSNSNRALMSRSS